MANKVVAIPEEMWERQKLESGRRIEPICHSLYEIEQSIADLLDDDNISDSDKVQLLIQMQSRYNRIYDNRDKNFELTVKESPQMGKMNDATSIIQTLPKQLQKKAKDVITAIQNSDGVVGWDEKNHLMIDGKPIENSNLSDLIKDLVDSKNIDTIPTGWKQFVDKIKEINVPSYMVGLHMRQAYKLGSMPTIKRDTTPVASPYQAAA